MNMYEYIGAVFCSGTLDNGEKWSALRACFASLNSDNKPITIKVFKVARSANDVITDLSSGDLVTLFFDERGRIVDVGYGAE